MTSTRIAAGLLAGVLGLALTACGGSSPVTPTPPPVLPTLAEMLAEKTVGSASAPVTMIEYSSLACSHCADFQIATYPQIKSAYIDTGRVKFVFRDFPLDNPSLAAAMVARCSGGGYFTTIDTLYRNQAAWAYSGNYIQAIKNVVAGIGITSAYVDACLATAGLQEGVLAIEQTGISQGVTGTPTFFINNQKVVGAQPFSTFAAIIDSF